MRVIVPGTFRRRGAHAKAGVAKWRKGQKSVEARCELVSRKARTKSQSGNKARKGKQLARESVSRTAHAPREMNMTRIGMRSVESLQFGWMGSEIARFFSSRLCPFA